MDVWMAEMIEKRDIGLWRKRGISGGKYLVLRRKYVVVSVIDKGLGRLITLRTKPWLRKPRTIRFLGYGTVWRELPDCRRAGTMMEFLLSEISARHEFKESENAR